MGLELKGFEAGTIWRGERGTLLRMHENGIHIESFGLVSVAAAAAAVVEDGGRPAVFATQGQAQNSPKE